MLKIVIIGNSAAGFSVLENLIRELPEKQLTVISREAYSAYRRNLLIDYFSGKIEEKDMFLCSEEFYKRKGVIFYANSEVEKIDTKRNQVILKNRSRIDYDYLVVASGNKVNIPDISGKNKDGVFAFYYLEDVKKIKNKLMLADTVCVTGEINLCVRLAKAISFKYPDKEIKIITRSHSDINRREGRQISTNSAKGTFVRAQASLPAGQAGNEDAGVAEKVLRQGRMTQPRGSEQMTLLATSNMGMTSEENNAALLNEGKIELLTGFCVQELIGEGGLQALKLDNGKIIASSLLLFAGEYSASSGFLKDTGINNDNGYIRTDENMRTNLENIFACGSVVKNNNSFLKDKLWKDCIEEGGIAASAIIKLIDKRNIVLPKV